MYIQITNRCNIACAHCCYTCRPGAGKHMTRETWCNAIVFARDYSGSDFVAIGGGEPTLHPEFFDILKYALDSFEYVWLATNGTRKAKMKRLYNIINQEDHAIYQEDKLTVALSTDYYHDHSKVDAWVYNTWQRSVRFKRNGFELRNVSGGVIAVGRAKRTGVWSLPDTKSNCVCNGIFINPDGDIKPCGCLDSPVIGHVSTGISAQWQRLIRASKGYKDYQCYKAINLKRGKTK